LPLGQEINVFFNKYGQFGNISLGIAIVMLTAVICKTLIIIDKKNISTYNELVEKTIRVKSKFAKSVLENMINMLLLVSFFIMMAGIVAFFKEFYNLDNLIVQIVVAVVIYCIFMKGVSGLVKTNFILVPILIVAVILIGTLNLESFGTIASREATDTNVVRGIISAVLYASYNSLFAITILVTLRKYITKKHINKIAVFTGLIIYVLAIIIYALIGTVDVSQVEIPMLQVANGYGEIVRYGYGIVLIVAILTTVMSCGYSFLRNVTKSDSGYKIVCAIICGATLIFNNVGFAKLVETLYPIFGVLGLLQIVQIIKFKSDK
jgi:uncharacterized membrane protein YkvI